MTNFSPQVQARLDALHVRTDRELSAEALADFEAARADAKAEANQLVDEVVTPVIAEGGAHLGMAVAQFQIQTDLHRKDELLGLAATLAVLLAEARSAVSA